MHAGRDVGHDGFSGFWRQMDGFVRTMNAVDYILKNHDYSWKYYLENFAQFAIGICRASLGKIRKHTVSLLLSYLMITILA